MWPCLHLPIQRAAGICLYDVSDLCSVQILQRRLFLTPEDDITLLHERFLVNNPRQQNTHVREGIPPHTQGLELRRQVLSGHPLLKCRPSHRGHGLRPHFSSRSSVCGIFNCAPTGAIATARAMSSTLSSSSKVHRSGSCVQNSLFCLAGMFPALLFSFLSSSSLGSARRWRCPGLWKERIPSCLLLLGCQHPLLIYLILSRFLHGSTLEGGQTRVALLYSMADLLFSRSKCAFDLVENFSQGSPSNQQESLSQHRGPKKAVTRHVPQLSQEIVVVFWLREFHNFLEVCCDYAHSPSQARRHHTKRKIHQPSRFSQSSFQ